MNASNKQKRSRFKTILKFTGLAAAVIIILPIITLFAARGVNHVRFRLPGGVREQRFIELNNVPQYINIRGADTDNPVVIWLHGGPGSSDSYFTTTFQRELEQEFTFIRWDQRGCGRSYYKNKNVSLSFDLLLADLDALVDYATERFNRPVMLVGHSWGTALGITYAAEHPEKIAGYVGIGQMVDGFASERLAAEAGAQQAREAGNEQDAADIEKLYRAYAAAGLSDENCDLEGFVRFRGLTAKYLSPGGKDVTLTALLSPDFGWDDLRWSLLSMTDITGYFTTQKPLYSAFDDFTPPARLDIPAVFIQGENDYTCSTVLAEEYARQLSAPSSEVFILPGTGHLPMFDDPSAFGEALAKALNGITTQ